MIQDLAAIIFCIGALFAAGALVGAAYLLMDVGAILLLRRSSDPIPEAAPPMSVLVPLCGAEKGLAERLRALCTQDYGGAVQLVCAVADPADPAASVAEALRDDLADRRIELVIDARSYGPNRKISNLVNALRAAEHDTIVMLDSDIHVDDGYLARLAAALARPGVGAVTNLYHGVADGGLWAKLSALSINAQFIPSVVFALRFRMAEPCFGATIAMSRAFLESLGGLAAFADH